MSMAFCPRDSYVNNISEASDLLARRVAVSLHLRQYITDNRRCHLLGIEDLIAASGELSKLFHAAKKMIDG